MFYTLHEPSIQNSPATVSAHPRGSYPTTANALLHTCSKEWYLMLSLMNPPTRQTPKTTIAMTITPNTTKPPHHPHPAY